MDCFLTTLNNLVFGRLQQKSNIDSSPQQLDLKMCNQRGFTIANLYGTRHVAPTKLIKNSTTNVTANLNQQLSP